MFLPVGSRTLRAFCFLACCGLPLSVRANDPVEPTNSEKDKPLHQRIDDAAARYQLTRPTRADDLLFLRRVTLDLAGRIPTRAELDAFQKDTRDNKRADAIDRLLEEDDFYRHWSILLDVMFMERRGGKHVKPAEFRAYLSDALRSNKPFHHLCAELIAADGTPEKQRAASAFFLERDAEPNLMARETGRLFFGVDLQCAQCHDHPSIDDYHQSDYFGLYAFVARSTIFRPDNKKPALLQESAEGLSQFKSVFTDRESLTQPRLPNTAEIPDPFLPAGSEYKTSPSKNVRGIPAYSRRERLAQMIHAGDNSLFRRNVANRIWALLLGRGIVHPVDLHHADNPPSNPELLELISAEFAATNFNLKSFIREIALSGTYQVAATDLSQPTGANVSTTETADAADSLSEAADAAIEAVDTVFAKVGPVKTAWEKSQKAARDIAKKRDAARTSLASQQAALKQKTEFHQAVNRSHVAAFEAAKLLKDKDILTVATKLKMRETNASKETTKLQAGVTKATATLAAEEKKLAPALKTAAADYAKLEPVLKQIQAARGKVVETRRALYQANTLHGVTEQLAADRQQFADRNSTAQDIQKTRSQLEENEQRCKQLIATLQSKSEQASRASRLLADAKAAMQQMDQRRSTVDATAKNTQSSVELLAATLDQIKQLEPGSNADLLTSLTTINNALAQDSARLKKQATVLQQQVTDSAQTLVQHEKDVAKTTQEQQQARQAADRARQSIQQSIQKLDALSKQLDEQTHALLGPAVRRMEAPVLQALTPEQFCWSALHATGRFEIQIAASTAKLNKDKPLKPDELKDPAKVAARNAEGRVAGITALEASVARFVRLFAAQPGQPQDDFFATVDQALYTRNGSELRGWTTPSGSNLGMRLFKTETAKEFADELYLSVFTRSPTDDEVMQIVQYLNEVKDKRKAIQDIVWALLTSVEFRFQQ